MTDLTDKWKKGELPDGYYYCKTGNGVEILRTLGDKYNQLLNNLDEVFMKEMSDCKIISEVPCYDEWFKIKNLASLTSLLQEKNIECLHRENKLKERIHEFAEANQSLRKQLDGEKAKNRIDYYNESPMDFLDECERDRKKNKIYKNLINNIREELIISDLRKTGEGNKFIVNLLDKINQALGEDKYE